MSSFKGYSHGDVTKMLGLSSRQVRTFVEAGLLSPRRDKQGDFLFNFQDLVLLRTAKGLIDAEIPTRRVRTALEKVKDQLPKGRPLTGVQVFADGKRVVVQQGTELWNPESGQAQFNFEVASLAEKAAPFMRQAAAAARENPDELEAEDWYELACDLELATTEEARDAYRRTLELDPDHADAHLNLGRLLHEEGEFAAAEKHYRHALHARPDDATAVFNLGVVLQDLQRSDEAIEAYKSAIKIDADYADAYYNLSGLFEELGQTDLAIRHFKTYKKLVESRRIG